MIALSIKRFRASRILPRRRVGAGEKRSLKAIRMFRKVFEKQSTFVTDVRFRLGRPSHERSDWSSRLLLNRYDDFRRSAVRSSRGVINTDTSRLLKRSENESISNISGPVRRVSYNTVNTGERHALIHIITRCMPYGSSLRTTTDNNIYERGRSNGSPK